MRALFSGGVHPAGRKELSEGSAPRLAPVPAQVVLPLAQHIGEPCRPLVRVGEQVKLGQKIGDGDGLFAPVHASVSGRVAAVEPRRHPNGKMALSVVIENDFQDTPAGEMTPHPSPAGMSPQDILDAIHQAGVVGMGGATFPTSVKAMSSQGKVDTIIANACECEPYITADDALLCTHPDRVLGGMELLMQVLGPKRAVLAVEDNKAAAVDVMRRKLRGRKDIELLVLPTRYPQGSEKQLIYAVTGRQVPPGGLPSAVGCAVFNAATFASAYQAVHEGVPVTSRIVTVTGEGVRTPQNLLVRLGTPFSEVIRAAGGLTEDIWKVIAGGPMMGTPQQDLTAPVIKGTNAILCLSTAQNGEAPHPACIRCGKCVTACPMQLQPLYLYHYEAVRDVERLVQFHVGDCIECGCCAYACPGKLPLVERFRAAKQLVKERSAP